MSNLELILDSLKYFMLCVPLMTIGGGATYFYYLGKKHKYHIKDGVSGLKFGWYIASRVDIKDFIAGALGKLDEEKSLKYASDISRYLEPPKRIWPAYKYN